MPKKTRLIQRKSPACDSKKLNQQIKYWKDEYDLLQEQCNQLWTSIQQQQQSDTSESSNDILFLSKYIVYSILLLAMFCKENKV